MHISLGMHIIHCLLFQNGAAPLVFRHVALTILHILIARLTPSTTIPTPTFDTSPGPLLIFQDSLSGLLFPPPMNKLRQVVKSYIKACSPLFFHTVNGDNTKHVTYYSLDPLRLNLSPCPSQLLREKTKKTARSDSVLTGEISEQLVFDDPLS